MHDYSENYACGHQNEIQSRYFDMGKVSLHVTILYRPVSPLNDAEVEGGADVPIDEGGADVSVSVVEAHGFRGTDHTEDAQVVGESGGARGMHNPVENELDVDGPRIIKEHIFALTDDATQDHHAVVHIQKLISNDWTNDLKLNIKKMQEFTDGCAGQYKSRHCLGDVSCSLANLGYVVQRNYFGTSYAKGEQDTAGANVKQKATTAVLRRSAIIRNAQEMCDYLTKEFSKPSPSSFPSRQKSVDLNQRLFFYIPSSGEHSIVHNRTDSRFREVKGVRKIHSVRATAQQLKVLTRPRSCYFLDCLDEDYDSCENQALVGDWTEVNLQREASLPKTRSDDGGASAEYSLMVADLASKDSAVALAAHDHQYDYYLMKVTSNGTETLKHDTVDDYGSSFVDGQNIVRGHFLQVLQVLEFGRYFKPFYIILIYFTETCKTANDYG